MKAYHAYCFDLYGTLVDIHTDESKPSFWKAVAAFYTEHGAEYTGKTLQRAYKTLCTEQEDYLRAAAGQEADVELNLRLVFSALYQEKGVIDTEGLIRETAVFFRQRSTTHLRCYAGAKELLSTLRERAKILLMSNAQSCFTVPELEALGLSSCFDRVWISSDVGFMKPDPRFFQAALEDLGEDPAECLMIGNDPACDMDGGKKAGMDAFYIHSALSPQPFPKSGETGDYCMDHMDLRRLKRLLLNSDG